MAYQSMSAEWVDDTPPWSVPTRFWPFDLVKALPYAVWHPHKSQKDLVSQRFFVKEKLWAQQWKLYYFWAQATNPDKPLILVAESQALDFIGTVQDAFPNLPLSTPTDKDWPGLVADFGSFQGVQARPLGVPIDTAHFNTLKNQIALDRSSLSSHYGADYVARLKTMIRDTSGCLTDKQKRKREAAKQAANAVAGAAFMELQKNLGLRSSQDNNLDNVTLLATNCKAPWTPVDAPVFVSIDVEWDELNHSAITEVGVSTLDVHDILGVPPGHLGCNWQKRIKARHFWIEEYRHIKNTRFVQGCPEAFQFGKSEIIRRAAMSKALAGCFKLYNRGELRPVVLVGHEPKGDIECLRQLGFDVTKLSNLSMMQDTAQIHAFLTQSQNKPRLAAVLEDVGIEGWFLHNGGNDAYYTLAACIGLAVAHRQGKVFGDQDAGGQSAGQSAAVQQLTEDLIAL